MACLRIRPMTTRLSFDAMRQLGTRSTSKIEWPGSLKDQPSGSSDNWQLVRRQVIGC